MSSRARLPVSRGCADALAFRFARRAYLPTTGGDGAALRYDVLRCIDVAVAGSSTV